jgi:hypothetical protein
MSLFSRAHQAFDHSELSVLQAAYEDACRELKIDPNAGDGGDGDEMRHALAAALLKVADAGERNTRILKTQALLTLKAAERQDE